MKKVVRDGKVAVLLTEDYGSGWWTWSQHLGEQMLFDPEIVQWVEAGKSEDQIPYFEHKYRDAWFLGFRNLGIEWVLEHSKFLIQEQDGVEFLCFNDDKNCITA